MNIVINGKFLEDKMQGIVRYATQIVSHMDQMLEKDDHIILLCPQGVQPNFVLNNIKVVNYGSHHGIKWELFDLKKFLKQNNNYVCLNLCNVSPLIKRKNITTIHDVMYREDYKVYKGIRNKVSALWHRYQYRYNAKNAIMILTVSNYSKTRIEKYYPKSKGKIEVTYNGWDHVLSWGIDKKWNDIFPFLTKGDYFFSLASLSKNKNGKWIIEVAKRNPNMTFAIGGRFYNDKNMVQDQLPNNVHLLGFLDDDTARSLIENCKAFLFPSINEGFGLPPLEALCLGAKVISSNVTSMPEILNGCVHYIDPYDYDVNLDELLKEKVEEPGSIKKKLYWSESSKKLYTILKTIQR